ncbi:ArsB/NhaD family transporter [Calidifontibacter sp. DB0510]|uniref:ArsB/NhaD family transporter n=1 Tax=Metallococcus carri TaxID=1656884 RepID=A0A967E8D7_9MICO|nr:ArsB/NhaD family transporter [Metallococcus carri]NHN55097.1 ArsB/NhaD family transporter [Metallococcus carri]NOP36174.1 ArsB/NhaD family transporter [Calidifontibacter sp. DB2511S]
MQTAAVVAVFLAAYVLIATERIHRVAAALGGAALMVLLGAVDEETAFFSTETGVDWNVIFLLLGMMILVSVIRQTGAFEFLAIWAAKKARGRPLRIMVMLVLITAIASALLDNVTTVLLIAPVTLLVCDRLDAPPVPFLIAEAMASNIGGAATLIGDPPNIIIGSRAGLSFNDFLVHMGPIVVVLLGVFLLLCKFLFARGLEYDAAKAAALMKLDEKEAIRDKRLLVTSGGVLALVIIGFVTHSLTGLAPSMVALLGAGAAVALSPKLEPAEYLEEVEWPTLVFFAGLFVMVGGLVHVGVIGDMGKWLTSAIGSHWLAGASAMLWVSGLLSGIVDNIPYVATMAPLVVDLTKGADPTQAHAMWWSLTLGADLGGNATAVGASANVVVLGIAARNGHPISFWRFTKYGLIVAPITIAIAWGYVWLRYFALA